MFARFQVLTTPSFERDFRKTARSNQPLVKALEDLVAILGKTRTIVAGSIPSRNSVASNRAKDNGEFVGENTVCDTTSSGAKL